MDDGRDVGNWNEEIAGFGIMLLFLLVLLGIGYALYGAFTSEKVEPHDLALEELRVAYARGELTQEEFEQRWENLKQTK